MYSFGKQILSSLTSKLYSSFTKTIENSANRHVKEKPPIDHSQQSADPSPDSHSPSLSKLDLLHAITASTIGLTSSFPPSSSSSQKRCRLNTPDCDHNDNGDIDVDADVSMSTRHDADINDIDSNLNTPRTLRSQGDKTPTLVQSGQSSHQKSRSMKRQRLHGTVADQLSSTLDHDRFSQFQGCKIGSDNSTDDALDTTSASLPPHSILDALPKEVIQTNICSYFSCGRDHYALQLTCKKFKHIADHHDLLKLVDLAGDSETGKGGILYNVDCPEVAITKLYKHAKAGNQMALC